MRFARGISTASTPLYAPETRPPDDPSDRLLRETSAGKSHACADLPTRHRDESARLFTEVPPSLASPRNLVPASERTFIADQLIAVLYRRLMAILGCRKSCQCTATRRVRANDATRYLINTSTRIPSSFVVALEISVASFFLLSRNTLMRSIRCRAGWLDYSFV